MAITYPLNVPTSFKVNKSSFRLKSSVGVSTSDFTYAEQKYKYPGERWEGEVSLRAYGYAAIGELQAFALKLQGKFGSFLYGDPDFLAKGLRGAGGGTPQIDGASQTGSDIDVKGLPLSTSNVWKAGDYIQLGTGSSATLHMVLDDVDSDGSGLATASVKPNVRVAPADSSNITTTGAKGVFRLASNVAEWNSNQSSIYEISFAFVEEINV